MLGGLNSYFFQRDGSAAEADIFVPIGIQLPSGPGSSEIPARLGALFLLVLLSPLLAVCALLVKLSSRGPVLYSQERVGLRGRTFRILKFRSMVTDAEAGTGAVLSWKNDPRVTAVGKWLRNLHLDELPQLVNVLRGEMAFIGPRPERPEFVSQFNALIPAYSRRAEIKPGITGLAQVCDSYDANAEAKLKYDLMYLRHASSVRLNLFIVLSTVRKLMVVRFNQ